ncbi:hypothetical protein TNCT_512181 [Trichonephila clavata]|uniref:Uncharacterized protein n=1 Tax=Trichonephila clavata TaxID=2740835 RepID=A0A8X6FLU2_TRICU|nr:hypothetical protein TNCT_512181 [Trichonephila clavata]
MCSVNLTALYVTPPHLWGTTQFARPMRSLKPTHQRCIIREAQTVRSVTLSGPQPSSPTPSQMVNPPTKAETQMVGPSSCRGCSYSTNASCPLRGSLQENL